MSTIHLQRNEALPTIDWSPVAGVQQVVFVARVDDRAVAILELVPQRGFRLTRCSGELLGEYSTLGLARDALEHAVVAA